MLETTEKEEKKQFNVKDPGSVIKDTLLEIQNYWKETDPVVSPHADRTKMLAIILVEYHKFLLQEQPAQFNPRNLFSNSNG